MRRTVLRTIRARMKYSNGVETTTFHTLYLTLSLFLGIYRCRGFAWIAKSIHDFCSKRIRRWIKDQEHQQPEASTREIQNTPVNALTAATITLTVFKTGSWFSGSVKLMLNPFCRVVWDSNLDGKVQWLFAVKDITLNEPRLLVRSPGNAPWLS